MHVARAQQLAAGIGATTGAVGRHRARRTIGMPPAPAPAAAVTAAAKLLGATAEPPAGAVSMPPLQRGDQGVSASEAAHARRVTQALLQAPGVQWVATYLAEEGVYELRSRSGVLRWERWKTPTGEIVYRIRSLVGDNPVNSVDPTLLRTIEQEVAAAGGSGRPVPHERTSYPDILRRLTQLWDHRNAPDLVYIPTNGGDPNHPGAGSHGVPDLTQSRAPLIVAGPGIRAGATTDAVARVADLAPTVAEFLGVQRVAGSNGTGVQRSQFLRWQDGSSLAAAVADARAGAALGAAERAVVLVADGASQTVLLDEVRKGRLPNIARLMRLGTTFDNGSIVDYPTVTWANHNTIMTGASPGHHGIVNNSWYSRETGVHRTISDGGAVNALRVGTHMEPQVETIYEAVRRSFGPQAQTVAINQPSGRGATTSVLDLVGIGNLVSNLFGIAKHYLRGRTSIQDRRYQHDPHYATSSWRDNFASSYGASLLERKNPPKLITFDFALSDSAGHEHGPQSEQGRAGLQEVDRNVGRILDTLERRGLLSSTLVMFTSDHGMEHQERDPAKLGGWFQALQASGVKTIESTRFVYIRSMRVSVVERPSVGAPSHLALQVVDDDARSDGTHPPVAGAEVTVRDAAGTTFSGRTDEHGRVRIPVQLSAAGPLTVTIEHPDMTTETAVLQPTG